MPESNRPTGVPGEVPDATPVPPDGDVADWGHRSGDGDVPASSEAFQTLASDVRLAVLVHLLRAEREDADPTAFSDLQERVGSDSSAGFAYHLRQLDGHFVRKTPDGYVLTDAGRRAARAVLTGTFTASDGRRAS